MVVLARQFEDTVITSYYLSEHQLRPNAKVCVSSFGEVVLLLADQGVATVVKQCTTEAEAHTEAHRFLHRRMH